MRFCIPRFSLINCRSAIVKALAVLGAITISATATAGSSTNVTITQIFVGNSYGSLLFIAVTSKTGNPACNTNATYNFVLPLTTALENQMLAVLLSARATGATVTLTGNGLCDQFSNVETLENVSY